MFTDWKTTVTGIVVGVTTILAHFGVIIPESVTGIIIAIGIVLLGYFAKDKKES